MASVRTVELLSGRFGLLVSTTAHAETINDGPHVDCHELNGFLFFFSLFLVAI